MAECGCTLYHSLYTKYEVRMEYIRSSTPGRALEEVLLYGVG